VTTVAAGPLGVAGLVDELRRGLSVNSQARNEMREAIGALVQEWSETAEFRPRRLLVVFIDDLDRCSEETVLAVCEAVKVYLDVPGLAFVIGCDRSALAPNGLLRDPSPAASAFMERIFHTSYRIPVADQQDVRQYIDRCARAVGIDRLLDERLTTLLAERSAGNPRRIKRLVNGFVLEATLNPTWEDFRTVRPRPGRTVRRRGPGRTVPRTRCCTVCTSCGWTTIRGTTSRWSAPSGRPARWCGLPRTRPPRTPPSPSSGRR